MFPNPFPGRAALIRGHGGLPQGRLGFGPPAPEIVEALAHGTSPILLALDRRRHNGAAEPALDPSSTVGCSWRMLSY